jgi:response regulator of citrate/malate metabolism
MLFDYVDKPIGLVELRAMLLKWTSHKTNLRSKEIFEASGNQFSSFSQPKSKKVNYDAQSLSRPYR